MFSFGMFKQFFRIILTVRREDSEIDGMRGDALVLSGHSIRLVFDLLANQVEVREALTLLVQELGIFYKGKLFRKFFYTRWHRRIKGVKECHLSQASLPLLEHVSHSNSWVV